MTKEMLKHYLSNKKEIEQIRDEIMTIREKLTSPGTQKLTGMPTNHSGDGDGIGHGISRIMELESRYAEKLEELAEEQEQIEDAISGLPSDLRQIMRARYIQGKQWETICYEIGYSWRQIHRLHGKALRMIS